jgi:mannose-6-phosphate isomerase-like protein (cupin superfamily)
MKVVQHTQITEPLQTPTGEMIYELIGTAIGDQSNHSLAYIVIPPGKSSDPHFHQLSQESYYILEGEGEMMVDRQEFTLIPGQVCYIEPGEIHQISNQGEKDLVFLAVCVPAWVPEDSFGV